MTYRLSYAAGFQVWRIKHPGLDDVMQGPHFKPLAKQWRKAHPTDTLVRWSTRKGWVKSHA